MQIESSFQMFFFPVGAATVGTAFVCAKWWQTREKNSREGTENGLGGVRVGDGMPGSCVGWGLVGTRVSVPIVSVRSLQGGIVFCALH